MTDDEADREQRLADIRARVAARPEPLWQAAEDLAWLLAEYDRREEEYGYEPPPVTARTECAGIWMDGIVPADEARERAAAHYELDAADADAGLRQFYDGPPPVTYWRGGERIVSDAAE